MANIRTLKGDCLTVIDELPAGGFDLIYLDPPFFTQKQHTLSTRDGNTTFSFLDLWDSHEEYACFLHERVHKLRDALSKTGALFFHCDHKAVHIVRLVLDRIFGSEMFQSEIIWSYKRWSNSSKGLLPAHQNILFYSKSSTFKFNRILTDYSESTNLDQIVQKRVRDDRNKAVYARDEQGNVISGGSKKGVPLSDVWEIPYLNPKAKERVGYPTQKPILLIEQIINLCTDEGDWILDPFCGSGTTLVAAKLLKRNAVGIDTSEAALTLTNERLKTLVRTESALLKKGRSEYKRKDVEILEHLNGLDYFVVQRNKGIDAILKQHVDGKPVFVKVQKSGETIYDAALALCNAVKTKGPAELIVITTENDNLPLEVQLPNGVRIVPTTSLAIKSALIS